MKNLNHLVLEKIGDETKETLHELFIFSEKQKYATIATSKDWNRFLMLTSDKTVVDGFLSEYGLILETELIGKALSTIEENSVFASMYYDDSMTIETVRQVLIAELDKVIEQVKIV